MAVALGLLGPALPALAGGEAVSETRPDVTRTSSSSATDLPLRLSGVVEAGFLSVLKHEAKFGRDGTVFDYRSEGGQDTLFFVKRFSAELEIDESHVVTFLYQPLRLETAVELDRDVRVDSLDFPAGTTVDLLYDFPFYRLGYACDFLGSGPDVLAAGLALQIRNARISFRSADGTRFRDNRDVGPVPLLSLRGRWSLHERVWLATEIDGIYAPVSVLNGSDTEVVGALLDASLRAGAVFGAVECFANVRYLGGGAVGDSGDDDSPDDYVRNWLHFFVFSLGLRVRV